LTAPVCDHKTTPAHCTNSCAADSDCAGAPGGLNACSTTMTCVQCTPTAKNACMGNGPGTICLAGGQCGCMSDADCGGRTCDTRTNKCPKPDADLTVTVTHSPDPAQPNNPITYQVNVHNNGPATAPGPIVVNYNVPDGGTITSVVPGDGWRCMVADRTVTCTMITPLLPGDAPPIKILVTPDPSGTGGGSGSGQGGNGSGGVHIKVSVGTDGSTDSNLANNVYEETTSLNLYRVAGGGFGCSLVSGSQGLSLWGAAGMALAMLLGMSRLRRRRRAAR